MQFKTGSLSCSPSPSPCWALINQPLKADVTWIIQLHHPRGDTTAAEKCMKIAPKKKKKSVWSDTRMKCLCVMLHLALKHNYFLLAFLVFLGEIDKGHGHGPVNGDLLSLVESTMSSWWNFNSAPSLQTPTALSGHRKRRCVFEKLVLFCHLTRCLLLCSPSRMDHGWVIWDVITQDLWAHQRRDTLLHTSR